jgi:hypothetical protein
MLDARAAALASLTALTTVLSKSNALEKVGAEKPKQFCSDLELGLGFVLEFLFR